MTIARFFGLGLTVALLITVTLQRTVTAQDSTHGDGHRHDGSDAAATEVEVPKIFLDKSPRVVQYQLQRLDNHRLLLVPRKTDDPKYVPVYQAILSRAGMSPLHRQQSVDALVTIQQSDPVSVLLAALQGVDTTEDAEQRRTARELAGLLLRQPATVLNEQLPALQSSTDSENQFVRSVAYAGLIAAGQTAQVLAETTGDQDGQLDWLRAVELLPQPKLRAPLRQSIVQAMETAADPANQRAAIAALALVPGQRSETFDLIAAHVADEQLRPTAVKSLLKIAASERPAASSAKALAALVDYAESTPPEQRTSDQFTDAMQLADQLMARVPTDAARQYRQRLSEVTVRLIRIKTVEEEMRYDTAYFAVEAGRPVQIVLENHDLMPHNLVLTAPGALKEVAQLGLQAGPAGGWKGLQYVPETELVLHATDSVATNQQARLTFDAPSEPGEYPYVCTFPQHWYRMYGVMVVVENLDEWLKNPVEPANPIGSNRSFVQSWTVDDLKDELETGMRGRSPQIGKRLFAEASCGGCHKVAGEGGVIGPDLTDVFPRWKGDAVGVLREILDPSHKIDQKYAMQRILTVDGRTITGVLVEQNDDTVTLLSSPEAPAPTVVAEDDIEAMVPSSVSMMPKALLDQYTKDEIFEMMAYLAGAAASSP